MTTNAKAFIAGLGLLAVVAVPAVAMAKTHHVQVHHNRLARSVPPVWRYGGVRDPLYTRYGNSGPLYTHYGNIRDRQTYGLGY